ncbi:DUF7693 family protein [Pseudomonas sp. RT4P38]
MFAPECQASASERCDGTDPVNLLSAWECEQLERLLAEL